ncbi:MAG: Ig-like domain-containing protein [Thermoguttaceae bacterium]|nr:Ig-like domain-containing protein [Thermoguttaceae bacterium]
MTLKKIFALLLVATFVCFAGCGPKPEPTATVTGKVTCAGKPVTVGTVSFYDANKGAGASATIGADGTFTASKVAYGDYQIGVMPPDLAPEQAMTPEVKNFPVPAKFRDGTTSGLTCKVDKENVELPIDIK